MSIIKQANAKKIICSLWTEIRLKLLVKLFQTSKFELLQASFSAASSALSSGTRHSVTNDDPIFSSQASESAMLTSPKENEQHPTCGDAQGSAAGYIRRRLYLLKRHLQVENLPSSARCTCAGAMLWSKEQGGGQLCAKSPRDPWVVGNLKQPPW